jgi:hypothetical protein
MAYISNIVYKYFSVLSKSTFAALQGLSPLVIPGNARIFKISDTNFISLCHKGCQLSWQRRTVNYNRPVSVFKHEPVIKYDLVSSQLSITPNV